MKSSVKDEGKELVPVPQISVIMPAYGVEGYIARAVESVLNQRFRDFELIIVDDGSPDRTGAIADEFAAKDERVRVTHQENAGAPIARNRAMARASGKYFFFMDADDWAEPDMLGDLFALAEANGLDAAVAGFYIDTYYDETHFYRQLLNVPAEIFPSRQAFREAAWRLFDKNQLYPPWNKLFRADYLRENHIEFPNTFWDDLPFNLAVFRDIERVGVTDKAYYHFIRARAESEGARYREGMYEKREEEHRWMCELYEHWGVSDPDSREMLQRRYAERVVGCVENVACPACPLSRREKTAKIREMLNNPALKHALTMAKPRSLAMKLLMLSLKTRCAPLVLLEGQFISLVKRRNGETFARLRANR